jgi:orotate phosphoribosyltransferase
MSLNELEILKLFKQTEALLEGHFLLTSGRHSNQYFQCAKVLQYTNFNTQICEKIVENFKHSEIDTVIAPALGGIIVGQEVAHQLNKKFIFAEREQTVLTLRRGFSLTENERVLVCEDVVTTGGSVFEVIEIVKSFGAKVVGVGYIVDRSNGKVNFGFPQFSTLKVNAVSFLPEECELCKQGLPLVKPGSRKTTK